MHRDTKLTLYGRGARPGPANPPIMRASTILHDNMASQRETKELREQDDSVLSYGRRGTTTSQALAEALIDLEGGDSCFLYPSGVAAMAAAISAFVRAGDHLLLVEDVFHGTRHYCEEYLIPMGIRIDTFPWDATDISDYIRPETKAIVVESPTSQTFKVLDLPAICKSAHRNGLTVIADNTYASGWFYKPLELGCDLSMISGTKYLSGHADTMMGAVVAKIGPGEKLRHQTHLSGQLLAPDEAYACLRGMRTLALRMERHCENALAIVDWLKKRREVKHIWHPALPDHSGNEIWKRDACGTNGLLSLKFNDGVDPVAFVDRLRLFSVGSSWGGYESLALITNPSNSKSEYPQVRLHAGIENIDDLLSDLNMALEH